MWHWNEENFLTIPKAEKCNRIHYEPNGPILSPGYLDQNLYPPNLDCLIQIKLEDSQLKIAVFFLTFELEDSTNCVSDYLRIDSNDKLCGRTLPDPYFKNSNSLDMYFHTNDQLQGKTNIFCYENGYYIKITSMNNVKYPCTSAYSAELGVKGEI